MRACVDIGGTKVAVSLALPGNDTLMARQTAPTAKTGRHDAVAQQVLGLIDAACAAIGVSSSAIEAVGVSSAGPFVLNGGCIELATPNICGGLAGPARGLPNDWMTAPIEAPLRARFARVRVENDAVAALEAERRWGALQGLDHCAYVTWSTGVGVGLCVDGRPLRGKNGNAGHAGHTFVADDDNRDALCGCGNVGDVEGLVAGNAIARRFGLSAQALFKAAITGEPEALRTTDALCRVMGRTLYNLVATLDLQAISLGGSVFWHNRDFLLPRLQAQIDGHLAPLTRGVRLHAAGLGDKVGDYAALALVD
ncbi:ROK family protein [Variovorax sp. N23]|uniref:ROK family protein n=1 Tax=Variovorax sp. N23 TaxID=2980555 RepID=UPI0021C814B0|nr:ROK family protein [Variovorax sp. N23]MCU4119584.1 ROK family protein [Variovorax sp. N23]